uniref:CSON002493 protein n=1 Tax=Culicoides sonorensis TaxID=179676 RepID=A0A336KZE0_CULSO
MSTFEVSVTPTRVKQMRQTDEARIPTDVFMGPFTPKATVSFVDIPVGKTARRFLTIHNKFDDETKILVTKVPKPELCISLEWTSIEVGPHSSVSLQIVWNPVKVGIFKDVVQLTDSKGNKKDIYLALKAIELKKPGSKKQWTAPVLAKRLKASPQKAPIRKQAVIQQKASILKNSGHESKLSTPGINKTRPLGNSNLNATNIFNTDGMNFSNLDNLFVPNQFDKENKSPITPPNASNLFSGIKFTPATETIPKEISCIDYLASLPTPTAETYTERKRPASPEHVRFTIPEKLETTQNNVNASDISVMAQLATPNGLFERSSILPNKTITITGATPLRGNQTTNFEPHIFSTITKMSKNLEADESVGGKELFFDALDEMSFATPKPFGSMERLSSETYVKATHLERLSSETYNKCSMSPMSVHEDEAPVGMDKTRIVTPPPPLSMIEEECEIDTSCNNNLIQKTFHIKNENKTPPNHHKKVVEEIVMTPLSRARLISKSTRELNMQDLDLMNLKANQGSMPNLFDERTNEQLRNIENNRYFFQTKNGPVEDKKNESMTSTTSNLDTMFRESEIKAQSSQFNLHDIGKSTENIVVFNKTVTKHVGMTPAMSCLDFTKSRDSLNSTGSSTNSCKIMRGHKPYVSNSSPQLNRGSVMTISPPKSKFAAAAPTRGNDGFVVPSVSNRTKTWGAKQPKKINLYKYPMKLTLQPTQKQKEEERVILYNPDLHISAFINPDPFAATTTVDPFLASTMYLDERSTDRHEQKFKKWLNALVTIPEDLDSNRGKIDVGKLFNEVQNKKQTVPDTKEKVVSKYYKTRLDYLRTSAIQLYQSREVSEVLTKLMPQIEKGAVVIRDDKDLHLQIGLQQQVLDLLFAFNTLWLRLGLEVVFGEIIPMSSNRDVHSLARFIIDRMFKDQYLEKKYTKVQLLSNTYKEQVKKHTLKKFFCLLMFLDTAKNKKIIKQNPCLFTKMSPYKETREVLLRFSSMLLSCIGDVTKYLKRFGYVLTHKQTYLDEFDYAFTNLAVDLRDGVRLTKVMEIISLREDLSCQLRVPAVSRLQKVHNVDVALKALTAADYQIKGDITPKDIADGHREKTLSLLWQIIHKFRAPKFNAAAITIQHWWRRSWLRVSIARRIHEKKQKRMENAATMIQKHFRGFHVRKWFKIYRRNVITATIIIQKNVRRFQAMKKYKLMKMRQSQEYCASVIQNYVRMRKVRKEFLLLKKSTITIQKHFRGYLLMKSHRNEYLNLKKSVICIQDRFRANQLMKQTREKYLIQRNLIINVQQKYRAMIAMREARKEFLKMKSSAIQIQTRFRATQLMQIQRNSYQTLKSATILIQQKLRATLLMRSQRRVFLLQRQSAITIQRHFMALLLMKRERTNYILMQLATCSIQTRYRAQLEMRRKRKNYLKLKEAAKVIQVRLRAHLAMKKTRKEYLEKKNAVIVLQNRYRALIQGRMTRQSFMRMRCAAIVIQTRFRATVAMKKEVSSYKKMRKSSVVIQRFYRGFKLTQNIRKEFLSKKHAAMVLQKYLRATIQMRHTRVHFLKMQYSAVMLQQCYRGLIQMRKDREEFLKLKGAVIIVQNRYRAQMLMKIQRERYQKIVHAAKILQIRYRAKKQMELEHKNYLHLKEMTVKMQARVRANLEMKRKRDEFMKLRTSTVIIQRKLRATLHMKHVRDEFLKVKSAAIIFQRHYRALISMRSQQEEYLNQKSAIINIQRRFHANLQMKSQRSEYLKLKSCVILIQNRYRATLAMRRDRENFLKLKSAAITIQTKFRARNVGHETHQNFIKIRNSVIRIQNQIRAVISMKRQRTEFLKLKSASIVIQSRYRAKMKMREQRMTFIVLRQAVITIQAIYRANTLMKEERAKYVTLRNAAITVQNQFRAQLAMKLLKSEYEKLRSVTVKVQQRWRAVLMMRRQRMNYLETRQGAIVIQERFRAMCSMKLERRKFEIMKMAAISIQRKFRAHQLMKIQRIEYLTLLRATITLQLQWKSLLMMRETRKKYLELRSATCLIQKRFKNYLEMKKIRQEFISKKTAAIVIQQKFHAIKAGKSQREYYLNLKEFIVRFQARIRGFLDRKAYNARLTPEVLEARRRIKAARKIQAVWRGFNCRKKLQTKQMKSLSKRINASKKTMRRNNSVKIQVSIDVTTLKGTYRVYEAITILKRLERLSRIIPQVLIPHSAFIATFCYGLMAQTIRSEPDKQVIELCACIILNLSRYPQTKEVAFSEYGLMTIAQMLLRWCDKECGIFIALCTLIWIFGHDPDMNQKIRKFMVTPDAIYMLRETKKLTLRKEKMRQTVKKQFGRYLNDGIDSNEKKLLPNLEPDYGLIKGKPYVFMSPVFALDTVLSKFNVEV